MTYGLSMNVSIKSFEDLEARYLATKPIRGTTIVPLDLRRNKTIQMVKHSEDKYSCRFYNTDCVTYYRDGSFEVNTNGWNTRSTQEFMYRLLPTGYTTSRIKGCIHLTTYLHYNTDTRNTNHYKIGTKPVLVKDGIITGFEVSTKQIVDKPATKIAREKYQPFILFARGIMEVLNIEIPKPASSSKMWDTVSAFYNDPAKFNEAEYLDILACMIYERWYSATHSFAQIKAKIYKAGTVYQTVELPVGEAQR
jgi:hypothetical protein